jgi:AraC-like DNA-binding protein
MQPQERSLFKYLPIAESDRTWGLFVTGSGKSDVPPKSPYPLSAHPAGYMFDWRKGRVLSEFQVIYITRGRGFFQSRISGRRPIREGSVILLFPDVWHRYTPDARTGWKEHWISFNGALPQTLMRQKVFTPGQPVLQVGLNETLVRLYTEILELVRTETIGFREVIASLSYQILAQVSAAEKERQFGSKEVADVVQRTQMYLVENIRNPVNVEQLAEELGVGYSWFRHRFRQYTGLSPTQYFIQLRLNRARELLSTTSYSIQQISEATGFQSQYYFSRLFKEKTGMTPTAWRRYSRGEGVR